MCRILLIIWVSFGVVAIFDWIRQKIDLAWVYLAFLIALFLGYLLIDDPIVDALIPCTLLFIAFIDVCHRIIQLVQAKWLKCFDYSYKRLFFPLLPCFLAFILLTIQTDDMTNVDSQVNRVTSKAILQCYKTQCRHRTPITQGQTTLLIDIQVSRNCAQISSYLTWVAFQPVKKCLDTDQKAITVKCTSHEACLL